jgi:hypothetical protein
MVVPRVAHLLELFDEPLPVILFVGCCGRLGLHVLCEPGDTSCVEWVVCSAAEQEDLCRGLGEGTEVLMQGLKTVREEQESVRIQ